jgi:hypothetical protein
MPRKRKSQRTANIDQVKWNKDWEEKLEGFYAYIEMRGSLSNRMRADSLDALEDLYSRSRTGLETQTTALCSLQKALVRLAVERFTTDDLEDKWLALTQKRREEIALEGIWKASHIREDLESHRQWCPEITVRNLAGSTENGFLQLLQRLMPNDLDTVLTEHLTISNPLVDLLFKCSINNTAPPDFLKGPHLIRSFFITMTLWQTLLAFVSTTNINSCL